MKKILAIVTALILALSFVGCASQPDSTEKGNDNSTASYTASEKADGDTASETLCNTDNEDKTEGGGNCDIPPEENIFYNPDNTAYDTNALSVKPGRVYWEGETLVAECFVINGFNHNVFGITVKELTFSNKDGVIASGSFGELQGLTLAPYTNTVWTFRFSANCIERQGADLTDTLTCNAKTSNYY